MNEHNFTPEESLLLISKTIEETKQRFQENGHIIVLWGSITFLVFSLQYFFELVGLHKKFDIIWTCILFPLGAIYTFIYTRRKIKKNNIPKTVLGTTIEAMGWVVGMNLMIIASIFGDHLGKTLAPIMLTLLAMFIIVIGISIKFKPITIGGILLNLIGFGTFLVHPKYYGFCLMLGAVVGLIIPGIMLNLAKKRNMFNDLDPILHSQLRLSIVSILMTVEEANFSFLKDSTKAAAGNISIQINKLQEAGYINVEKTFKNNYPNTTLSITDKGRKAFEEYVKNLQKYIYPKD